MDSSPPGGGAGLARPAARFLRAKPRFLPRAGELSSAAASGAPVLPTCRCAGAIYAVDAAVRAAGKKLLVPPGGTPYERAGVRRRGRRIAVEVLHVADGLLG